MINVEKEYAKFFSNEKMNNDMNVKKIIDSIAGTDYFLIEEKTCDLNEDHFSDKIIILGNKMMLILKSWH